MKMLRWLPFSTIYEQLSSKVLFRDDVFVGVLPSSMSLKSGRVNEIAFEVGTNIIDDNTTYTEADDVNLKL